MNLKSFQNKIKDLASRVFQKNKYERVLKDYQALALERPDDVRILIKIAETNFKAKQTAKAIETYEQIAAHYLEKNFVLKAVAMFKNILKLDPNRVETNLKLAELYLKMGLKTEATNQYKIALQSLPVRAHKDQQIELAKMLIEIEPLASNYRKLAEIYQAFKMTKEAMLQFEVIAKIYRQEKKYDELLRIYELILPYKPNHHGIIRDLCVLYLRKQQPDPAIRTMERYKVENDPEFATLYDKAKLMKKALRSGLPQTVGALA